jgi:hypothetical protein
VAPVALSRSTFSLLVCGSIGLEGIGTSIGVSAEANYLGGTGIMATGNVSKPLELERRGADLRDRL